ncbi:mycothiol synthase [Planobispora rosea]|uniref:Mycothiol acetyltransferase n=1 Tax=Planobispora rosea TaxID=35762 RepID=A0A8J3SF56_PLARO|nr:mycothiol synthase [Planobispora rosea]GIH88588.1 mycothiol acetyltransferase [Planobispora rosea]
MNVRVEHRGHLDQAEVAAVLDVVRAATETDGVRPLNEHVMLHLRYGGDERAGAVLLYAGDELAGYAHVDPTDPVEGPSGELVVHPGHRRRGYGRRLLEAVLERTGGRLRLWAHGGHPGAEALATAAGLVKVRSLWQMRRPLDAPIGEYELPEGVRLRTFDPETDREAWVALNARAFMTHPEQGAWTLEDLKRREQESWFDPDGFFLAVRGDRPVGFHWTKVHGEGDHAHGPIGEVYVVGVDPAEQGGGLGRSLTLAGLAYLRSRGLPQVMLYVDESNAAAVRLYERLGFTRWNTDVMFQKS